MRKTILLAFLLLGAAVVSLAQNTLPVTGTFINLPYQDVRNKYTNPEGVDGTDPQMWATKVAEMGEMGMEYLVFMSVAGVDYVIGSQQQFVTLPSYLQGQINFFGVGVGKFKNFPNLSLIGATDTNAKMGVARMGLRYYLTERFVMSADYSLYTAFLNDQRSTQYNAWTLGLSFFF